MNITKQVKLWLVTSLFLCSWLTLSSFAGKPGGGGGGTPPPPPLPDVRFSVDLIPAPATSVTINQINNLGVVVGRMGGYAESQAFLWDNDSGRFYDLNNDLDLQPVRDQMALLFGADWFFRSAVGINDLGQVVGMAENTTTGQWDGFILDTIQFATPANWMVMRNPDLNSDMSYGRQVNESGDVLGVYARADGFWDCYLFNPFVSSAAPPLIFGLQTSTNVELNNSGEVAGMLADNIAFFDPAPQPGLPSLQTISSLSTCLRVGGLNDSGVFSVNGREIIVGKRNRITLGPNAAYRFAFAGATEQSEHMLDHADVGAINSDGDVALAAANAAIAHAGFAPNFERNVWSVKELIDENDPLRGLFLNNTHFCKQLNDRGVTGFGQIAGYLVIPQSDGTNLLQGVVLTPFQLAP